MARAILLRCIPPDSKRYGQACYDAAMEGFVNHSYPGIMLYGVYHDLNKGICAGDEDCRFLFVNRACSFLVIAATNDQPVALLRNSIFTLTTGFKLLLELKAFFESTITASFLSGVFSFLPAKNCMEIEEYVTSTAGIHHDYNVIAKALVRALSEILRNQQVDRILPLLNKTALVIDRMQLDNDANDALVMLLASAKKAISCYLSHALMDQRPALIQGIICCLLEDGNHLLNNALCTEQEREFYQNPQLKKMLELNAYEPESAKSLITFAHTLCSLLQAFSGRFQTKREKVLAELQQALKVGGGNTSSYLSIRPIEEEMSKSKPNVG